MAPESILARVWAPATLTAASTVAVGFAVNLLTSGRTGWWWLVLGTATIAGIVGAIWTFLAQKERGERVAPTGAVGSGLKQTARGRGTNISINADNGSAAAYKIDEVNLGLPRRRGKRADS